MFAAPSGPTHAVWNGAMQTPCTGRACQVSLIDRRTGRAHRISGQPLVRFTKDPNAAVEELLAGRDTRFWEARVELLDSYEGLR